MNKGFFENFGLKLFSLVFAITLWFFVSGERKTYSEQSFTLDLEFKNIPSNLIITDDFLDKVEIRVSGRTTILSNTRIDKYTIDLTDITPGLSTFSILTDKLALPPGLRITKISPKEIALRLEEEILKKVPVRINIIGKPAEGYKVVKQSISTNFIAIKGAKSELDEITFISTVELNIDGAKASVQKELDLVVDEKYHNLTLIDLDKQNISATIEIEEAIVEKEFKDVPVSVRGIEGNTYSVVPDKMDIILIGPFLNMDILSKEDIVAYVEAENVLENSIRLKPAIELPFRIDIIETIPVLFEVTNTSPIIEKKIIEPSDTKQKNSEGKKR